MEEYQVIVEKVMKQTFEEFMQQIRYLLRYSKNGPIHIIHELLGEYAEEITKYSSVSDLTDDEKLILMIHWAFEYGGLDKYRETPFSIIYNITDAELVHEFNRRCKDPNSSVSILSEAVIQNKE